jgi:hypothetical protein
MSTTSDPFQGPDTPRQRILTAYSRESLEIKVRELLTEGWEREGDVAVAKSVVDSEMPYFCQTMVKVRTLAK